MFRRTGIAVSLSLAVAAHAWAGLSFTSVTKSEGQKGRGAEPSTSKVALEGDKLRMEMAGEKRGRGAEQGYFLTQDGGKTLYMVNAAEKSYMKMDLEAMGGAGGMVQMAKSMTGMKFSNVKVEKVLEEKGEDILGYATKHYRFKTSYQMEMNFFGRSMANTVVQEEDIWAAPKLKAAVMSVWSRKQMPSVGDPELDKLVNSERGKVDGLPLRTIVTSTTTDASGKSQVSKTTTEVTEVKEGNLDNAQFELPAGYQEMQMPAMPPMPGR
jgi:hypothetical protein